MKTLLDRLHARLGDLWWYSLMIFVACRSGDVIQAFIGLWLVPKYVGQEELGAVLPLQQLSGLFAVPLAILATVFAKYVNTYATRGEYGKVKSFIRDVLRAACAIFIVCIGAAYLIIPHFYERLNIQAGLLTVLVLAAGFASNIASIFTAALQGLKKFKTMTVQNLISAPIRLVTLLVAMPFRALSGYILGQATPPATCTLLAAWTLRKDLKAIPLDTTWRKDLPEIGRYLWPVAVYMGVSALCASINPTIYRQRLPEIESSAYYLLSRLAEISSYASATIVVVLFPYAAEAHEQGKDSRKLLLRSVQGILGSTAILSLVFAFLSQSILNFIPSWSAYSEFAPLLPIITLSTGISSASVCIVSHEAACKRRGIMTFSWISNLALSMLILVLTGHNYFRGILSDAILNKLDSMTICSLNTLTSITLVFAALQFIIIFFSISKKP